MATKPMDQTFTKGQPVWCLFQSDARWKIRQGNVETPPRPGGMLGNEYQVRHGEEFVESYSPRNIFPSEASAQRIKSYRNRRVNAAASRAMWCPRCKSRRVAPGGTCSACDYHVAKY